MAASRAACQRVQLLGVTLMVLLLVVYVLYPSLTLPRPTSGKVSAAPHQAHVVRAEVDLEASVKLSVSGDNASATQTDALKRVCETMSMRGAGLEPDVRHVMRWVCGKIGAVVPRQLDAEGCNKSVTYNAIGRLGNLLNLYAIIFSYSKMYGASGYIDTTMWNTIRGYFPHISLPSTAQLPDVKWKDISYQQAEEYLACEPGSGGSSQEFYRISNYPDRNGIDVFHPFYSELRQELQFSDRLQQQAQEFLHYASANRSSTTFIGFHIRRTDYQNYINSHYNSTLPDEKYFAAALEYYRSRYADALFIVCSDDMNYVEKTLRKPQQRLQQATNDIVTAGNRNIDDPGRDMALLAACNHSIVTVGTYGFWGAYLAGGTVLVPEKQTHLSLGDRGSPLLEIQLAGATNWIALRSS